MKKAIFISLILFCGCREIVDIGGIFLNRLNNDKTEAEFFIKINNISSDSTLPNFLIHIIRDDDSVSIVSPKMTTINQILHISLPDEQINPLTEQTQNIIVTAEYPGMGTLISQIALINLSKINQIDFFTGLEVNSVPKISYRKYKFYPIR